MARIFTVDEARSLMPAVLRHADDFVAVRADLAELTHDLRHEGESPLGGLAEAKGLEARMDETLSWFDDQGIEIKGVAPLLVDFPALMEGVAVRLCWLEGETALGWYHRADLGFPGRRPLP
ncbi:DUF2203 domain-containing protein [Microbispora corallina]|uniref:DUF2203 family protein n=1 Tax=Microbispora corallina TaxID=83302 RepID=A0ABQ4FUI1_9ACTN|nr:DUF2203 domain-containing protein [Microbispora corallina]GIH38484.1 hypothetical protein Mco01_14840 [Microbispora corallina]